MTQINTDNLPLWVQDREKVLKSSQNVKWRYGAAPDYTTSTENLAKESNYNHPEKSLESIVQNLVRTFDIEANFKTNPQDWLTVVQDKFRMSTNGGTNYQLQDLINSGTYKLLIGNTQHYKASEESFETSTNLFHTAFPEGFLWEVLEVYSPPPTIVVKWRHWGHFLGDYKDYVSTGETIEVIGISIVKVSDDLKIISLEHYYDNTKFLDSLTSGGKAIAEKQQKSSGETQTSNPLQQKFMGFIKNFLPLKKNQKVSNSPVSRCPFAAFMQ